MLVQSRHITVLGMALHFGERRTWPVCFDLSCFLIAHSLDDATVTERRVLPSASAALQHDFSNCNKGEKEPSVLPPVDRISSCFQFLHEVWSEWCLQNWQCISVTQEVVLEKTKKEKKIKKNPGRNRKKGEKKRSSTLAFLEVAWGIAKEIPSDITRFYDRELPYETVRAWCSPV